MMLKDKNLTATSFHKVCNYELANVAFFIERVLQFGLDSEELENCVTKKQLEHQKCTCREKQEKMYGDYAKCSCCMWAPHCGRDCQ
eukprot:2502399-Ditylum_brightwellii.AAC.1